MPQLITIGKITKNQGNKGEVKVSILTDFPERFYDLDKIIVENNNQQQEFNIENIRYHKQALILKLKGINDIQQALSLKNKYIKIKEKDLIPLKKDEYYIYQLLGCEIITLDNKKIGHLKEVETNKGTDIFLVEGHNKDYMIPASKNIVKEINLQENRIIIDPISGLLDL